MTIEIVQQTPCPTCGGTKEMDASWYEAELNYPKVRCTTCSATGTVPRVLATFADAAELRKKINNAVGFGFGGVGSVSGTTVRRVRDSVLSELGVSDDQG